MTREHGAPGARLRATRVRATRARASSVLAAVILVSACGSYAATTITAARTAGGSCPSAAPRFRLPAVGAGRAKLVPAGPVTAAFCQYGSGRAAGLPRRVPLTGVAARPAARCTGSQLGLTYLAGGASAGNDFGTLLVRDVSARPCTLAGPLRVTGLDAGGQPDTATPVDGVQASAVLTPDAGPIRWRPPGVLAGVRPGELTGLVSLISEYRDGPAGVDRGLCQPLWVVPASWRVTLPGGTLTVPNADGANPAGLVSSGGFVTCRGRLSVAAPATVGSP
jgi:hypothetical protein